jgi:hypothetical protein
MIKKTAAAATNSLPAITGKQFAALFANGRPGTGLFTQRADQPGWKKQI